VVINTYKLNDLALKISAVCLKFTVIILYAFHIKELLFPSIAIAEGALYWMW
jgi:hypothetical protein